MRIARIDLWHVAVPLPAPFRPSWIPGMRQTENRFTLLRLRTESGLEGYSAAPSMAKEREGLGSLLGPYLLGERADDLASIRQRVREMGYLGYRVGWIEPAAWDLVGKARGLPVWRMLREVDGRADAPAPAPLRLYASTGEVRTGAERVREVEARLAEGFRAVKLRVHADTLEEDLAQLEETRRGVGDDVILGVDANQAWRVAAIADAPRWNGARAHAFCERAAELGFTWVEEPLPMDDYAGLARLRGATGVKLAGGELNGHGLPEFGVMLEKGCYDWYQPDAVFTGGIAATWAIIKRVQAAGASYSPHTWTNGIGFAINLQLFAASSFVEDKLLEYPLDPPGWVPGGRDGLLAAPWHHDRGTLAVPMGPGLGFEIDARALRRYGRRFYTGTKTRVAISAVRDRGLKEARLLGATRQERLAQRQRTLSDAGGDPMLESVRELVGPS